MHFEQSGCAVPNLHLQGGEHLLSVRPKWLHKQGQSGMIGEPFAHL